MPQEQAGTSAEVSALVGRDGELRQLVQAVGRAPGVVVVEGEAGIGKTRLVSEMAGRRELAGVRVLVGGCRQIREPFPLGPVLDAVRGVGAVARGRRLSAVTGALRPLLPELAELLPEAPAPLHDHAAERHRVFRGLVSLLAEAGRAVLVVEDAHWADEQTVDFLGYLLGDPPPALTVVLTYRGEEADAALRHVTARLGTGVGHTHLLLHPLDAAQTRLLASAILRTDAHVSEEFAVHLCERASGIPFVIQELLALLRERGSLVLRDGNWSRRAIDDLDIPAGVRNSVLSRVLRLSAAGQAVVEAAAVLVEPVPVEVLTATCQVPAADALDGLTEGLAAGLLQERDGTVGFRHALAAQAVYASMLLPRRQDLHRRAAAAVRSRTPVPLGQVAHHLRQARQYDAWVGAAEAAAEQAAALADDAEAARLLEDVLRTAPLAPADRVRLTIRLGDCAQGAVRWPDVQDLLEQALALEPPPAMRGLLHFQVGLLLEASGSDPALVRRALAAAVEDLQDPFEAALVMNGLGFPFDDDVPAAEHAAWLGRALATADTLDDPRAAALVRGKAASQLALLGDRRWRDAADLVLEHLVGAPAHRDEAGALYSVAEACLAGHDALAARLLAIVPDARSGPVSGLLRSTLALVLDHARGAWREIDPQVARLLEALRDRRYMWIGAESVAACLQLARGEPGAARDRLGRGMSAALSIAALEALPPMVTGTLRLAVAEHRPVEGIEATAEAFDRWRLKRLWPLAVQSLPALVAALAAAERTEEAGRVLREFEQAVVPLDAPLAAAALPRARGLLAAHRGDHAHAAGELAAAAQVYSGFPRPYEAAQCHEEAAAVLLGAGDPAGQALLREAIEAYEELDARWDHDRASRLSRDHGLAPAARHRGGRRGYGDRLSPRERQVAVMAAAGRTNREIGETLFLSTRTVEGHLGTVLRKLGLRSRIGLAHRLGEGARTGGSKNT
ncbi:ATP-binding protein [Streptomyces sp. NPDC004134]|uniref:ATP-binding protein n=1 Tax=Streptomyces sp. NPDC004134 TaxID=3364691 RepID=UPI0036AA6FB5